MNSSASHRVVYFALPIALGLGFSSDAWAYSCPQTPSPARTETYQGFLGRVQQLDGKELPYRLFVPKDYDAKKAYPLVLYLHHAGLAGGDKANNQSGWDNCVQLTSEIGSGDDYGGVFTHRAVDKDGKRFDTQERYPHFVLAPHAETSNYGFGGGVAGSASGPEHATRRLLWAMLDAVRAEFNIDASRLYVTGISMGCYGTWDIIMRSPGVFAAASPQSCRGDPDTKLLAGLKALPVWSMCGTKDSYFSGAQAMADGMKQVGATAFTFTAMDGVGHSINDRGYDYAGFIDWMFAQHRTDVPATGGGPGAGGSVGNVAGASGAAGNGGTGGESGAIAGPSNLPLGGAAPAGGSVGSAGSPAVTGGTGAAPVGAAGASGATAVAPNADDSAESASAGCSLSSPMQRQNSIARLGALLLAVGVVWRRSQRRARRSGGDR